MNSPEAENTRSAKKPSLRPAKATRMERAILALLQNATLEKAAEAVDVHPTTLRRWLKQPEFQQKYHEAQQELYVQFKGRLQQGLQAAVGMLFRIMTDPAVPANTRLQAAKYVMDRGRERAERAECQVRAVDEMKIVFVDSPPL